MLPLFYDTEGNKMNRVYSVEEIVLQGWNNEDGTPKVIKIHPLTIKKLRKLYTKLDFEDEKVKNKTFIDLSLDAVAVAMETFEPELSNPKKLEEYIDQPTLEHILKIAAGIEFNDQNLTAAIATMGQTGTT
jgi:hypothetical protein